MPDLVHPTALERYCPVPPPGKGKRKHTLLNRRMFIFETQ
jgi:hypothetical protein